MNEIGRHRHHVLLNPNTQALLRRALRRLEALGATPTSAISSSMAEALRFTAREPANGASGLPLESCATVSYMTDRSRSSFTTTGSGLKGGVTAASALNPALHKSNSLLSSSSGNFAGSLENISSIVARRSEVMSSRYLRAVLADGLGCCIRSTGLRRHGRTMRAW